MISIDENTQLWLSLGYCVFMLILGIIIKKYPPKKINPICGYRTNRSMKNQVVWNAANAHSAELMVRFCTYSFIFPVLSYFVYPKWNLLITILGNTFLIILVVFFTEKFLNRNFDKDGNQLSQDSMSKP